MKTKAYVLFCALGLFATAPVYGQGQGHHYGRGHGRGNPHSDKGGHNENGSDKGGHDENGSGHNDDDDGDYSLLNSQIAGVVSQLAIGTLTTPRGEAIPISAQGKLYVLLTNSTMSASMPPAAETVAATGHGAGVSEVSTPSVSSFYMALSSGAGASADAQLVRLIESLSGLSGNPRRATLALKNFNEFVAVASPAFLASPPPDFLALHAVLAKMTAGLSEK